MNYHNITKCDMLNGNGIRVVLWVSGCSCKCKGCQNQQTWDFDSGIPFDEDAKQELFNALDKPYIKGLTISGGHPFEVRNREVIFNLVKEVKTRFPTKDIWIYTGYTWEEIQNVREILHILYYTDVLVDGPYIENQRDISLHWRGSKNQRVIAVKESLNKGDVVLYDID